MKAKDVVVVVDESSDILQQCRVTALIPRRMLHGTYFVTEIAWFWH